MDIREHYGMVLEDLLERRIGIRCRIDDLVKQQDALAHELDLLNPLIEGLQRYVKVPEAKSRGSRTTRVLQPYSAMSMRWAILKLAFSRPNEVVPTGVIASELLGGGYPSSANFSSKVSAILGQMVNRGEMEKAAEGWRITLSGVRAWEVISVSDRYVNRSNFIDVADDSEERPGAEDVNRTFAMA